MRLEDFFDFVGDPPDAIRLRGTRIDIEHVIDLHRRHMIPEQIAVHFAHPLDPTLVYAAITYFLANRAEVEQYLARRKAAGEANERAYRAQPESAAARRLRDVKARLAKGGPFTAEELASESFSRLREYYDRRRQEAATDSNSPPLANGVAGMTTAQPLGPA